MLVNNYDWMKGITFLDFIRDIGADYRELHDGQRFAKKRSTAKAKGCRSPNSPYQLVQAYDFLHLYETVGCNCSPRRRPVGQHHHRHGVDPPQGAGGEAFALTCPLITKADGTKFGKTESGNVWLDSALYVALRVLPVLAQHQRRGRQALQS